MKKHFLVVLILILISSCIIHADWPQYLGPNRDGISPEKGLKLSWPRGGPKMLWSFPLNGGYAGPAVSKGKVYVLDRIIEKKDILRCLDLSTGREEWKFSYAAPGSVSHPGSRTIPAIDGDYIYTCGTMGHVYCINIKTHKPVWKKNIWKDFGGDEWLPTWGIAQKC